jgi:hypothetical protein
MRGKTMALLGLVGLLLSGCIFFSDEPVLKRSDTFPGVGKWSCEDASGSKTTVEIKRDRNSYWAGGDPVWFKALEKGFYLVQTPAKPSKEIPAPGKRYAYAWAELEGNRLFFYMASMDGLTAAPSKALRAGVRLETLSGDTPMYVVKGKPDQVLRFLTSFRKSELMVFMACTRG